RAVGDVETAQHAAPRDALDLGDRGLDRMVRDRGEACEALGVRRAEPGKPFVVDAHHLDGGLGIVEAARGAEHAVEDLGLYAVAVLVLDPQVGFGQAADAALAVLVEPHRRHAVGAVDPARHVLTPGRTHAVHHAQVRTGLRSPAPAGGPVGDI